MARKGDYIIPRPGTQNLYAKFQLPKAARELGYREKVIALGTPNRAEAKASRAYLDAFVEHQQLLATIAAVKRMRAVRPDLSADEMMAFLLRKAGRKEQEPGTLKNNPDGSKTFADADTRYWFGADGKADPSQNLPNETVVSIPAFAYTPRERRDLSEAKREHDKVLEKDVDLEIVETYITKRRKNDEDANLVRATLAQFKAHVGGRSLAQCKRSDAESFIEWLRTKGGKKGTGLASGTIKRNLALLRAAIEIEIKQTDEPRLTRNIFALAQIEGGDEKHRDALTEEDMATVRAHLPEFELDELLMYVWHASTGIRPIEIHGVNWEEVEVAKDPKNIDPATGEPSVHRTRYVGHEGAKGESKRVAGKEYSNRALPIPQAVLDLRKNDGSPLLPDRIEGPLFERTVERICDAINLKLEAWGIKTDTNGKTFYSARHRVPLRFRAEGVRDEEVTRAIMGHNRHVEPHHAYGRRRGYGHRLTQWELKKVIDKIGY